MVDMAGCQPRGCSTKQAKAFHIQLSSAFVPFGSIGLEIARQLGTQGNTVLMGARDKNRGCEPAKKLQAEHIKTQINNIAEQSSEALRKRLK